MYIVRSALKSETSFNLCFKVGFWGQNRLEAATVSIYSTWDSSLSFAFPKWTFVTSSGYTSED